MILIANLSLQLCTQIHLCNNLRLGSGKDSDIADRSAVTRVSFCSIPFQRNTRIDKGNNISG